MNRGIEIDILNKIIERAREKKDGVFSLRGHNYTVKNGKVQFISVSNDIYERFGNFISKIGSVKYRYDLRKKMIKLYK